MGKILEVSNLTIHIKTHKGTVQAVRDVNFYLNEQETLAVVGESGSGKSITMKGIMGILPKNGKVTEGTVMYNGKDLTKYTEREMQTIRGSEIAMVFQDPMTSLNPLKKVGKQIQESIELNQGIKGAEAKKMALEMLEKVGIPFPEKRYNQYPHEFSGGMRQRVVIAIALSCDPYVLICDEPTTALDVTIQAKILELIQDLQKKKGISVIYITHDLGVVAKVADFVNVMYAGKIVETGSIEDIFYRPLHPYTWGLLSAMPDLNTDDPELYTIPGSPPNVTKEIKGDAFAPRNKYALNIDKRIEPPMFKVEGSTTHKVASWLMHPNAPKVEMPEALRKRIDNMMKEGVPNNGQE